MNLFIPSRGGKIELPSNHGGTIEVGIAPGALIGSYRITSSLLGGIKVCMVIKGDATKGLITPKQDYTSEIAIAIEHERSKGKLGLDTDIVIFEGLTSFEIHAEREVCESIDIGGEVNFVPKKNTFGIGLTLTGYGTQTTYSEFLKRRLGVKDDKENQR